MKLKELRCLLSGGHIFNNALPYDDYLKKFDYNAFVVCEKCGRMKERVEIPLYTQSCVNCIYYHNRQEAEWGVPCNNCPEGDFEKKNGVTWKNYKSKYSDEMRHKMIEDERNHITPLKLKDCCCWQYIEDYEGKNK